MLILSSRPSSKKSRRRECSARPSRTQLNRAWLTWLRLWCIKWHKYAHLTNSRASTRSSLSLRHRWRVLSVRTTPPPIRRQLISLKEAAYWSTRHARRHLNPSSAVDRNEWLSRRSLLRRWKDPCHRVCTSPPSASRLHRPSRNVERNSEWMN